MKWNINISPLLCFIFTLILFFFNDTATTEIYTLSLHDALPICPPRDGGSPCPAPRRPRPAPAAGPARARRSEEHTSELQSRQYLVCRLLLEKKKSIAIAQAIEELQILGAKRPRAHREQPTQPVV